MRVSHPKIRIIDDHSVLASVLKVAMKPLSGNIKCFQSPVSALQDFENCFPDLIIVDLMMPEMDGIEFARQFYSKFESPKVPVILCSGHITSEISFEAKDAGIHDVIEKPFNPSELVERIRCHLLPLDSPHLDATSMIEPN